MPNKIRSDLGLTLGGITAKPPWEQCGCRTKATELIRILLFDSEKAIHIRWRLDKIIACRSYQTTGAIRQRKIDYDHEGGNTFSISYGRYLGILTAIGVPIVEFAPQVRPHRGWHLSGDTQKGEWST